MYTVWKDKGKVIGKSRDLMLTLRSERRYAERGVQTFIWEHHIPLFMIRKQVKHIGQVIC